MPEMPMPSHLAVLPSPLRQLVEFLSVSPTVSAVPATGEGPYLSAIGKRIGDLLGTTFTAPKGSGLPSRLTLGNLHSNGDLQLYGPSATNPEFRVSPQDLDKLLQRGSVDIAQPPDRAVTSMQRKLSSALDNPSPGPRRR